LRADKVAVLTTAKVKQMRASQKGLWREKVQRQLEIIGHWRKSGQSIAAWAKVHGVDPKLLMGWVAYEGRWLRALQTEADHGPTPTGSRATANTVKGFVAAHSVTRQLPGVSNQRTTCGSSQGVAAPAATRSFVRIEYPQAGSGVVLHWPVDDVQALASWLKAMNA
jgi:hypothetical protein